MVEELRFRTGVSPGIDLAGVPVREQRLIQRVIADLEAVHEYHFTNFVRRALLRVERVALLTERALPYAACVVAEGEAQKAHIFRVRRDGALVAEVTANTMIQQKAHVTSLAEGRKGFVLFEAGKQVFENIKVGDEVEAVAIADGTSDRPLLFGAWEPRYAGAG